MTIIELAPIKNGAHHNQTVSGKITVPNGWAVIPEDMEIPETFPFVGVEVQDGVVTALTPGTVPEQPPEEPSADPVTERLAALESENKLLKEQVSAQADQAEFYENCIAEMAEIVYA